MDVNPYKSTIKKHAADFGVTVSRDNMRGTNCLSARRDVDFRKDINGLRAIAVMAVVLYHFGITGFSGGFVGVDVFFVISGFLMTGIIVKRMTENKFSLAGFYLDRARRIIPALSVLCAVLIAVCWFFLIPVDFETLGKHVASSVTFLSNIVYFNEINYFDASAKEKWLLHTWSLSVEWQFYIIYPLVIIFLSKMVSLRNLKYFLGVALILSFAASVYTSSSNQAAAFYLLPSRAWEMLAGGMVYLVPISFSRNYSRLLKYAGIIGMGACIVLMDSTMIWPGYLAALPVISAVAILYGYKSGSVFTDNAVSQFIGKISYSIYLWHWPLVVGIAYFSIGSMLGLTLGIVGSVLLGAASYYIVENPFRDILKKYKNFKLAEIAAAGVVVAIPFAMGASVYKESGVPSRYPFALITSDEIKAERARYWLEGDKPHPVPKNGDDKVLIIGNSHGIDLTYSLMESGFKGDITYIRTTNMCSNFGVTPNRPEHKETCLDVVKNIEEYKGWSGVQKVILHDDWAEENISDLKSFLSIIRSKTNAPVYVFGPKMIFNEPPSKMVMEAMNKKMSTVNMINSYSEKYYQERRQKINIDVSSELSDSKYKRWDIHYINSLAVQCGEKMECAIINKDTKKFLYFDFGHFTLDGAKDFGKKLRVEHPEIYNN